MEQINKIRIAMICHFSNAEVRSHLPLVSDRKLYTFVRKLVGLSTKSSTYGDIAAWDASMIEAFCARPELELHVISAHSGLKKRVVSYENGGVHYNFIRCEMANFLKHVVKSDDLWRKLNPMASDVHRLVRQIKPDLVLLVGTENAYYSGTVLGIKDVPVYILCQTIYNNPERKNYGMWLSKNATTEMEIFKEHKYFGVFCKMHYDLLKGYNPKAQVFKFGFPSKGVVLNPTETEKEYDFVNFALTMDLRKGFHDSLRALAIIKKKYPTVTLNFVGGCTEVQRGDLDKLIAELELQDNVIFTPFFERHNDLMLHVQKSRFAVLPCKIDNISGTMLQAMQLNLPLVVYKTAGTPSLNRKAQCCLIAEKNNVEELAEKMLYLMEHPEEAKIMATNARIQQILRAEYNKGNMERLISNFYKVIESFRTGKPIPEEYLFNPETDD